MIYPDWPAPPRVHAAFTTRDGGVSRAPYATFNLATHVGDAAADVLRNRERLRRTLSLPAEPLWLQQVHGNGVVDAACARADVAADASVAHAPGVVCAVLTADCLPVLLCERRGTRVAAVHAGWRGLAAGVLEAGVAALGCAPGEAMAWLGPAIGPAAFQVGAEVREAFVTAQPEAVHAFTRQDDCHWLADIYQLAKMRLAAAGVSAVYGGGLCTVADRERFFSYRREHTTGRMAALIWLA